MTSFTIEAINTILNGEIIGQTTQEISGIEEIKKAVKHHITFIGNLKYALFWNDSKVCGSYRENFFRIFCL